MPQFVILLHEFPQAMVDHVAGQGAQAAERRADHWDLMLESPAGSLWTWSFPPFDSGSIPSVVMAVRLADHRRHYLDYEGPVSGDRGAVRQIDRGEYRMKMTGDHELPRCVELAGTRFRGLWFLEPCHSQENGWRITPAG